MNKDQVVSKQPSYGEIRRALADADVIKRGLAREIASIIHGKCYSQRYASAVTGLTAPKVSRLLRGNFRGISEERMMRCLAALGQEVRIVIATPRSGSPGSLSVESLTIESRRRRH